MMTETAPCGGSLHRLVYRVGRHEIFQQSDSLEFYITHARMFKNDASRLTGAFPVWKDAPGCFSRNLHVLLSNCCSAVHHGPNGKSKYAHSPAPPAHNINRNKSLVSDSHLCVNLTDREDTY